MYLLIKLYQIPLTISPLAKENRVSILFKVLENLSNRQNKHYPRNTNPKKNGRTPNMNIKIFELANLRVLVMRLIFGLYSKYLSIISHAIIQPRPIIVSYN